MEIKDIVGTGEIVKQVGELIKEPIANIVNPTTETLGQRLCDVVDLIFTPVEIAKIYKDNKIELFKNSLAKKIEKIPEDNRVVPPLNIVGPAVEAAKYYIEDTELREMFEELIVGSMNSETSGWAHPSFVDIIKQLSTLEANILESFKKMKMMPAVDFVFSLGECDCSNAKLDIISNVVMGVSAVDNVFKISSSITNLIRLGLLERNNNLMIGEYEEYQTDIIAEQVKRLLGAIDPCPCFFEQITIEKGAIQTTSLGQRFIMVCIPADAENNKKIHYPANIKAKDEIQAMTEEELEKILEETFPMGGTAK